MNTFFNSKTDGDMPPSVSFVLWMLTTPLSVQNLTKDACIMGI